MAQKWNLSRLLILKNRKIISFFRNLKAPQTITRVTLLWILTNWSKSWNNQLRQSIVWAKNKPSYQNESRVAETLTLTLTLVTIMHLLSIKLSVFRSKIHIKSNSPKCFFKAHSRCPLRLFLQRKSEDLKNIHQHWPIHLSPAKVLIMTLFIETLCQMLRHWTEGSFLNLSRCIK